MKQRLDLLLFVDVNLGANSKLRRYFSFSKIREPTIKVTGKEILL